MSLGDELTKILIDFQMEIRKAFYFMKDGFKFIENRINEADKYYEEFEFDIKWLMKNIKKLKNSDPTSERIRNELTQIDTVARMYEFADTQQELAYRMAHVFMISIYEGFTKEIFARVYRYDPSLMVSNTYTLKKINSMSPNNLNKLILKKTEHISSVNELQKILNRPSFKIDIAKNFLKWNDLRENFFRRHIIVHKHGIYDDDYVYRTNTSKKLIGTEVKTDFNYIRELAHNICDLMGFLVSQFLVLFRWSISTKDVEEIAKEIIEKIQKHRKI